MSNPPFSDGGFSVYGVVIKRLQKKSGGVMFMGRLLSGYVSFSIDLSWAKVVTHLRPIIMPLFHHHELK